MKTPMVSSATSFQRLQTSLQSPMPRLPRSNVYSTRDPANPLASVHRKRFFTPSLTLKFLCAGCLNPGRIKGLKSLIFRKIQPPLDLENAVFDADLNVAFLDTRHFKRNAQGILRLVDIGCRQEDPDRNSRFFLLFELAVLLNLKFL